MTAVSYNSQRHTDMLTITLIWTLVTCWSKGTATPNIIDGSVSLTVLPGIDTQFYCGGTGEILIWEVDGLPLNIAEIKERGITADTVTSSGTVQSNLTVPATSVNNGTTVRCAISVSLTSMSVISNFSTLIVLPGIGPVLNLRFSESFATIMWDTPHTVGVLSNLTYHLTVTNMNTGVVIINTTTTDTTHAIIYPQLCVDYAVCVAAFSPEYRGSSVFIMKRTPGSYYTVTYISKDVFNYNSVMKTLGISIKIQLQLSGLPCPGQMLMFQTYPQSNKSDITNHAKLMIEKTGDVVYTNTAGIMGKQLYTASISVVGNEGAVDVLNINFSLYHVQHCDVHTDHTSYILVECTFAINSTAPGFVLIQDEHSQYTINTTLQRHEGDVSKGSVNITDLPTGEYRVTVYDQFEDYLDSNPATHYGLLQITNFQHFTLTSNSMYSTLYAKDIIPVTMNSIERTSAATPLPSVIESSVKFYNIIVLSSILTGVLVLICVFAFIFIICVVLTWRQKHKKEPDLTDQIPVEDNPVYITMKKIDLMKNNAYETVIVAKTPRLCMP